MRQANCILIRNPLKHIKRPPQTDAVFAINLILYNIFNDKIFLSGPVTFNFRPELTGNA